MAKHNILAFIMAGGEGSRLYPLTAERSKPSVPFGARYRIVDFVLSNLVNSGIHAIYLLVQYKSQSLIEHVRMAWALPPTLPGHFITVVPPQMRQGQQWFQGTADAVYQNLNLIRQHSPDLVLVFGADHVYRMDVRQMVEFHLDCRADCTVAALPVPREQAFAFGIIDADSQGRILRFLEKPQNPPSMPQDPNRAYASMGNYLFNTEVLEQALIEANARREHDFGQHVLPRLVASGKVYAYDFSQNRVPGVRDYEEPAYWRDVGTLDAYYQAHLDLLGLTPRFDTFNAQWPIISTNYQGPASKFQDACLDNSIVRAGCLIHGAKVKNSILRREVVLEPGVELDGCILMDNVIVKRGAKLRKAIVDRYNVIEAGATIGYDLEADRGRYHVTDSGIVVIPEAQPYATARTSFAEDL
nr:glucose-1-phosphate adenylyltransferase [uncultured Gammaproteobacteria bacterium]BAL57272.1 glucose-1-phosphate adenylyltransferase [uncultured Gammaproteobacteria bacterium]